MANGQLEVVRRPKRRTHLAIGGALMCGTRTATDHASTVAVDLAGGATARLRNDLRRELDGNTCIPCTRIALGMLALYVTRDGGRPW